MSILLLLLLSRCLPFAVYRLPFLLFTVIVLLSIAVGVTQITDIVNTICGYIGRGFVFYLQSSKGLMNCTMIAQAHTHKPK